MLSPASRGALMTVAIFLYVFMGLIAGYQSGRLYKTMKGKEWKRASLYVIRASFIFLFFKIPKFPMRTNYLQRLLFFSYTFS